MAVEKKQDPQPERGGGVETEEEALIWMMAKAQLEDDDFRVLESAVDVDPMKTLAWRHAGRVDDTEMTERVNPVGSVDRVSSVREVRFGTEVHRAAYPGQFAVTFEDGAFIYEFYEYRKRTDDQTSAGAVIGGRAALSAVSREPPRIDDDDTLVYGPANVLWADVGAFCESRQFRVTVPFSAITRAKILKAPDFLPEEVDDDDDDAVGFLVLRCTEKLSEYSVRRVHSRQRMDNEWTPAEPWESAGAEEHIVVGGLVELRNLAGRLSRESPRLATLFAQDDDDDHEDAPEEEPSPRQPRISLADARTIIRQRLGVKNVHPCLVGSIARGERTLETGFVRVGTCRLCGADLDCDIGTCVQRSWAVGVCDYCGGDRGPEPPFCGRLPTGSWAWSGKPTSTEIKQVRAQLDTIDNDYLRHMHKTQLGLLDDDAEDYVHVPDKNDSQKKDDDDDDDAATVEEVAEDSPTDDVDEAELFERLLLTEAGVETMPVRDVAARVMAQVFMGEEQPDDERGQVQQMILATLAMRDQLAGGDPEVTAASENDGEWATLAVDDETTTETTTEDETEDDSDDLAIPFDTWADEIPDFGDGDLPEFDLDQDGALVVTAL